MQTFNTSQFPTGWFMGNFKPSIIKTSKCEVAYKTYKTGHTEPEHFHRIAQEITLVIAGSCQFNFPNMEIQLWEQEMILIEPNERVKFTAITDCTTIVIKIPSCLNDKYIT